VRSYVAECQQVLVCRFGRTDYVLAYASRLKGFTIDVQNGRDLDQDALADGPDSLGGDKFGEGKT